MAGEAGPGDGRTARRPSFVHLRVHSAYSLAEGAIRVKELADLCKRHRMAAVAVTDTNNLFGALEISEVLAAQGIQPVIGVTLKVAFPALAEEKLTRNRRAGAGETVPVAPVALLATSEAGYGNLMRLSSAAFLETADGEVPHVSVGDLGRAGEGLIALTGGPDGPIDQLLRRGRRGEARCLLAEIAALFPGRLYVEIQRHGRKEERAVEPQLLDLAYALDLPVVATNQAYFPVPDMHEAHDALLCIAEGAYVLEENRRRVTAEHYFKSQEEMAALFADLPEAIAATVEIAQRCAFRPKSRKPILPRFETGDGLDEAGELRRQAAEGLGAKLASLTLYAPEKAYWDRLDYELGVINRMGFPGYFLIVSDFMKWTRARGIPVGVRGSGATSIVAWALEITGLDPLRFNLVFERFLNPERVSMPDFDIDFCQERRDEVIAYVRDRYGHDRVAQIITFGKLQARAVVRDVGRVLQLPFGEVDRIAKLIPNNPAAPVTLAEALETNDKLKEAYESGETVRRLIDIGRKLEGLYRHASTHAAGIVIGDRPLQELVPLYRDPRSEMPVTQFSMKWVEPAGLVKFDFLGLKTLTVIARTERHLDRQGIHVRTEKVEFDDPSTYTLLGRGDSVGVFQLESSGMRDLLRKMRPDRIEDLIALVALYRPGPMDSIPKYISCKHGREAPDYLHPSLEPILRETHGVMTYQEDVMQIARDLAGYSLGEADLLRRAMGKKIKAEMDRHKERFVRGAGERGIDAEVAGAIFDQAAKFAGYGFNKGHAAAYAQVAYQTAFLKSNHPVEFVAASMSLDIAHTDKLNVIRQEALRLGITIRPPDINRSMADFTVANGEILYALAAIKSIGMQAMIDLVAERTRNGPFKDIYDFAERVDARLVNRRSLETLIKAGAFDSLEPNRARLFEGAETILSLAHSAHSARESAQETLLLGAETVNRPRLPDRRDWPPLERLAKEFEAIGFYLSAHPLDAYMGVLKQQRVRSFASLFGSDRERPSLARLAGTVLDRIERRSQKTGRLYAKVRLTDASGQFEVLVFSDLYADKGDLLEGGRSIIVDVDVQWEEEESVLFAKSIDDLDEIARRTPRTLRVLVDDQGPLLSLRSELAGARDGRGAGSSGRSRVTLCLVLKDLAREVELDLGGDMILDPAVIAALKTTPGVLEVEEL